MTRAGILPEIQALRALAVSLVILFHLWPDRFTGGYVGVDVFFVISGYLITAHLLREADATGRVSLSTFYARRVRRLLPAALAVLAATLVAVLLFVPTTLWRQFVTEIGASAVYVVNWVLAINAVDYFASESRPSPVQHYWSLSVEEQFYLLWPLIIVAVFWMSRRRAARFAHTALAVVFAAVFVGSLVFSVVGAREAQQFTYFATPAHGWEFAAGGLLALGLASRGRVTLAIERLREGPAGASAVSWAGVAAIVASTFLFDESTAFPGWVALLPVAGALAIIVAGSPSSRLSTAWLANSRPVQFVGDVSYSAYLWHWPLIVIVPLALERELSLGDKVVILTATLVLAVATKRLVEDPARFSRTLAPRARTFAAAAAATALLVAGCITPVLVNEAGATRVSDNLDTAASDACFGAQALYEGQDCEFRLSIDPRFGADPKLYGTRSSSGVKKDCVRVGEAELRECTFGSEKPTATVAFVGDSHMTHFNPGLRPVADANDWQFRLYTRNACPAVVSSWSRSTTVNDRESVDGCSEWRDAVIEHLASTTDIDLIVVSSFTQKYSRIETAANRAQLAEAFATTWKKWTDAGIPVLVIADNPLTKEIDTPTCVAQNLDDPTVCALDRDEAVGDDALVLATERFPNDRVSLLDMTDSYCDRERCFVVAGGVAIYSDSNHLSAAWALSMSGYLERAIARQLAAAPLE